MILQLNPEALVDSQDRTGPETDKDGILAPRLMGRYHYLEITEQEALPWRAGQPKLRFYSSDNFTQSGPLHSTQYCLKFRMFLELDRLLPWEQLSRGDPLPTAHRR